MKEFYEQTVRRWLGVETWDAWEMSPLETVVWQECRRPEDARRVHDHAFDLMLKEIDRLEAEAGAYGGGEEDWMLASFHRVLQEAGEYEETGDRDLSCEESLKRRHLSEYRQAAKVYPLRRKGYSPEETAAKLELSEETVSEAERKLLRLFRQKTASSGYHSPASLREDRTRTLLALEKGSYRIFRRKTEKGVQYRFYCRDRLIGIGSAGLGADFPLVLSCGALVFNSSFDPDSTVFPGLSRTIVDADDPAAEAARLTWLEADKYALRLNREPELVTFRVEDHRFFRDDRPMGEILPLGQTQHMGDWELDVCMDFSEPLSDETALMLMSFPLLRFAL